MQILQRRQFKQPTSACSRCHRQATASSPQIPLPISLSIQSIVIEFPKYGGLKREEANGAHVSRANHRHSFDSWWRWWCIDRVFREEVDMKGERLIVNEKYKASLSR